MKCKPYTTVPLCVAAVCFLGEVGANILASIDINSNLRLPLLGAVQFFSFALPIVIWFFMFGGASSKKLRLRLPTSASIPTLIWITLLLFFGSMLLSLVSKRVGFDTSSGITEALGTTETLTYILIACVLPAVLEEFLYRGIVMSAFEQCGALGAVIGTSLLFSFSHMSLERLPIYFLSSVLLCFSAYVSRSIIPPVLIHTAYNIASVYGIKYINSIAEHLESFTLLFLIMLMAVFALVYITLSSSEHVYSLYAKNGVESGYAPKKLKGVQNIGAGASIFLSFPFLLCDLIFAAIVILGMKQ